MNTNEIHGTSVLILGYGREGKSTQSWLQKHYPALHITIADKTTGGNEYVAKIQEYDTVIRSPGVSPYLPELVAYMRQGGHVTTATNIFFSLVRGSTIGITGTKGKSTTSSLIAHILSATRKDVRLVGNIGRPMLDEIDSSTRDTVFVIELSSHQLVDIRYSPHIAVLLDIVPEHLDYYPDFASYKLAKENIFRFQKPGDHLVRNEKTDVPFATQLLGNAENISAAAKVARLMHVLDADIARQFATFTPLPHRLEFVGEYKAIRFYNDSLATIPEATIHALRALGPEVRTLIAGGYDRHLDYAEFGRYIKDHPIDVLILFPDTGKRMWEAVPESIRSTMRVHHVGSMQEAVSLAYAHTPKRKICLLSPAAASYNMFRDYADRGDQFKDWVKKIGR